jgi:hypothetical protein
MLTRSEIQTLQKHRSEPSISILAPTHLMAPANKQDRIKVKNLVAKAIERLHKKYKKREVAEIVKGLQQLVKEVDWAHTLHGLALFASAKKSTAVSLPFRPKPRVIIHETFATRDLVYALNRTPPYRVLVLSHESRLYDAWLATLEEHAGKPFPLVHKGPGGAAKLPGGPGINVSGKRDDAQRAYFRTVDQAVAAVQKADPKPLIIVGVERNLAFFQEVTGQAESIVGMLAGNHDKTSPTALGKLVSAVFETAATRQRTEALVKLDAAVSAHTHASGVEQVWREAAHAMVGTLLVEKDFKFPANVDAEGAVLSGAKAGKAALDDAVDELIERVMETGGQVYFYAPGDLDTHQKIAAILRR